MKQFVKCWWLPGALAMLGTVTLVSLKSARMPSTAASPSVVPGGTASTAEILRATSQREKDTARALIDSPATNPWAMNSPEAIPALEAAVARAVTLKSQVELRFRLVRELLWSNQNTEALRVLAELREFAGRSDGAIKAERAVEILTAVRDLTAISYLRIAEQENCVCSHNADSCIFPLSGGGVHARRDGAQGATAVLAEILTANPNDLAARWLINLTSMTLGEYPEKTPPQWLIPPRVFASDGDIGRFRNTAKERGVDVFGHAGGCILEDFDGDGHLDLMTSSQSLEEQVSYFWNRGDGVFEDRTARAGLNGQVGGVNLSHADYDNDGAADVLVLRGGWLGGSAYPHSLLKNKGDGSFVDVTRDVGMLENHPGQVGVWADFDNDGWVDLLVGHEADATGAHRPFLYHNQQGTSFREVGAACGLAELGAVRGAAWGDLDNDGWSDLYLSRFGKTNVLLRNVAVEAVPGQAAEPGKRRFEDVTQRARVEAPIFSHATWFFDHDNDGWLDLFVAGHKPGSLHDVAAQYLGEPHTSEVPRLYRNQGDGTFADVTREARLDRVLFVLGANFGDLDNDGYPDLYLGTGGHDLRMLLPNRMFRNVGGKHFQDVTTSAHVGHVQKGNAIAFGDIDGDGDQDIFAVQGGWYTGDGFRSCLFENPGQGNHWITLRLRGSRSNRAAIGARIKLLVVDGQGSREVHACVGTGGSFGSSSLDQEIGLGSAARIAALEVTWPVSGKTQTLKDVAVDRVLELQEE